MEPVSAVHKPGADRAGHGPKRRRAACHSTAAGRCLGPGRRRGVVRTRDVVLRLARAESAWTCSPASSAFPIVRLKQRCEKADAALDGALEEREAETASIEPAAAMQGIGEVSMKNELLRSGALSHHAWIA